MLSFSFSFSFNSLSLSIISTRCFGVCQMFSMFKVHVDEHVKFRTSPCAVNCNTLLKYANEKEIGRVVVICKVSRYSTIQ